MKVYWIWIACGLINFLIALYWIIGEGVGSQLAVAYLAVALACMAMLWLDLMDR